MPEGEHRGSPHASVDNPLAQSVDRPQVKGSSGEHFTPLGKPLGELDMDARKALAKAKGKSKAEAKAKDGKFPNLALRRPQHAGPLPESIPMSDRFPAVSGKEEDVAGLLVNSRILVKQKT